MRDEIEEINKRQSEFYNSKKKNSITKFWFYLRNGMLKDFRKDLGLEQQILDLHVDWCGDLLNKKVLDLGCYEGNAISMHLAKYSKKYIAIDLSEKGIHHIQGRIKNFPKANAYVMDFLSEDFKEKEFDLIYAYGVLHHFEDTDRIIQKLKDKLTPGGTIISNDPLETSLPIKLIRTIYRPFQSDKEWEFPFSKQTFKKYKNSFKIIDRRAMLGKSKYFIFLNILPLPKKTKAKIVKKWHAEDWVNSQTKDSSMFRCMHLTMLMQKKD